MKKIIKLLIICLLITGCGTKYETIDSNKAMTIINEESNTVIIDVRSSKEYNDAYNSRSEKGFWIFPAPNPRISVNYISPHIDKE